MPAVLEQRTVRTAIFVDFDNMFGGLTAMDPAAAESFATDPGRLLAWLEYGEDLDGPFRRRFLMKACYLNPDVFRRYRSFFVSAGFRAIDCPSLTQKGKSAADIHLVLDVVDTLEHKTRFEEFIICSSDADFTPLMVKLRAHDRRTVMVAAGPAAAAYQSVCDETVTSIHIVEAFAERHPIPVAPGGPSFEAGPEAAALTGTTGPVMLDDRTRSATRRRLVTPAPPGSPRPPAPPPPPPCSPQAASGRLSHD
jgi:hypothetical protein